MGSSPSDPPRLGSLTQAVRGKQFKTARGILFFVGIVWTLVYGYQLVDARSLVKAEMQKELRKEFGPRLNEIEIDQVLLKQREDQAVAIVSLIAGGGMAIGLLFVGFGFLVKKYPVPITISALVIFIGMQAVIAVLEPASLAGGIIIKVIIVVALIKAIQSAIAYQKEEAAAAYLETAND